MLKNAFLLILLLLISLSNIAQDLSVLTTSARSKAKFNKNWKFDLSDNPDYRNTDYNDSDWRTLNLPHDWSVEGEYSPDHPSGERNGFFPEGIGWYHKTFSLGDSVKYKQLVIQFDGVYMNSEVWINDKFLGRYPYGYTTFQYDITEYLNFGEGNKNVIAVRVDNSLPQSTRWYNGSGIYRNVHLITTNYTHFNNYDGVYITTPVAEKEKSIVNIDYKAIGNLFSEEEVEYHFNHKWERKKTGHKCILRSIVFNTRGNEIARTEKDTLLYSFDKNISWSQQVEISSPDRWSAGNPNMYVLKSEIEFDNKILDDVITPFGIRKLEYIPHKGMFVNGISVKLKGVCLHHDGGSVGAAVPDKILYYRLKKFKETGCNAIRTAHNPFAPEFYDMCDTMGFYVMDEAHDEWTRGWPYNMTENNQGKALNGYHLYFDQWGETDLIAMIRRDRNHPSVIMYSIGNEVPDQLDETGYKIAKRLVQVCHEEDPTRPATSGCDQYMTGRFNGFMDELDIAGYNYVERHLKDSMYLAAYRQWPEKLSVGTETGKSLLNFISYRDYDFAIGQFIWVGQDYLGESRGPPQRGSTSGLVDMSGNPRPSYYQHESYWSNKPSIHITANDTSGRRPRSSWNWTKNDSVYVTVSTNCEEVELLLNGKSLGRKKTDLDQYFSEWGLIYSKGTLEAIGYNNNKALTRHTLNSTGEPYEIVANAVWTDLKADEEDISIIEVSLVDKAGNLVPEANNNVKVEVTGPAKLIGIDSGNLLYKGSFKADNRDATRGKMIVIIQADNEPGEVMVKLTSEKLQAAEVKLSVSH
ncbi:sugar-binding domain-containing protein [Bacteroidota bacterium]